MVVSYRAWRGGQSPPESWTQLYSGQGDIGGFGDVITGKAEFEVLDLMAPYPTIEIVEWSLLPSQ